MLRRTEGIQTAAAAAARLHHETKNVLAAGILLFHLRGEKKLLIFLNPWIGFQESFCSLRLSWSGSVFPLWARRRLMERSLYAQLATERTLTHADGGEQEIIGVGESLNPGLFIWPGR